MGKKERESNIVVIVLKTKFGDNPDLVEGLRNSEKVYYIGHSYDLLRPKIVKQLKEGLKAILPPADGTSQ